MALLIACISAPHATAAKPDAGTVIANTAQATFFNPQRGETSVLISNTVRLIVQPQEALTLTPNHVLSRPVGGFVLLPHRLTNTGNATSTYVLSFANLAGDQYDLQNLSLVLDGNANGLPDASEPPLPSGTSVATLAPGQSVDVLIHGVVPSLAVANSVARVGLTATTVFSGVRASTTDTITVFNGAAIVLTKAASSTTAKRGDTLSFSITALNTGNLHAQGVDTLVDTQAQTLWLLRDVIPANTVMHEFGPAGTAQTLYHQAGQPEHSYSSIAPADLRSVDAIAFGFQSPLPAGQMVIRSFVVAVSANASGTVTNVAQVHFRDGINPTTLKLDSNAVTLALPIAPPTIALYANDQYSTPTSVLTAGQPFFVGLNAAQCNVDPLVVEVHPVQINSALAGDLEGYSATETGPNTGVFRVLPNVPTVAANQAALVQGDGRLSVVRNDEVTVVAQGCGSTRIQANLLVDPFGVVFDSQSNAPVAGAVVTLIDVTGEGNGGKPGQSAVVLLADGITPAPSTVTTGADGQYQFPLVAPSIYRLQVVPPPSHRFASTVAPAQLPADRVIDAQGSYGGNFPVSFLTGAVRIDVPLDANALGGLFIEKAVSRKTVELGEFVDYTIKLRNLSGQTLTGFTLTDRLPAGFAYQRGSARINGGALDLDGRPLAEPQGGLGPVLVFDLGAIKDRTQNPTDALLSYRVRVGPGALQGDGINRAQARSTAPQTVLSNETSAAVRVLPGVFTDRAFVLGTVYADCNDNREQDPNEPGIPGVRLFVEDGTHVVTDARGKYSLYGLRPITHVLKLDRSTLVSGAGDLAILANRQAGDAGSRFVDLKNGELHRADFALKACSPAALAAIQARAQAAQSQDQNELEQQANQLSTDTRAASAVLTQGGTPSTPAGPASQSPVSGAAAPVVPRPPSAPLSQPGGGAKAPATKTSLSDEQIAALDNRLAIVSPAIGQVMDFAQTSVIVKGPLGASLSLHANGALVPATRIGKHSKLESQQLQVLEYVGVDLKSGKNRLEVFQSAVVAQPSLSGTSAHIDVVAPGAVAQLVLSAPSSSHSADGRSLVRVQLAVQDAQGVPVSSRTAITLESTHGQWKVPDLNPAEPGVQIFIIGGRAELDFESPALPGEVLLRASSGVITGQTQLRFVPELRPLIAAGVVEGAINLRRLDTRALQPTRAQDGFEQELGRIGDDFKDGRGSATGRAALFLKGKVRGDYLLTLAFDSDKRIKERLFRDIQPGEYYPVYGDTAGKGFDAQSTGRLYVRVDKDRSHVLYGDYNTQPEPLSVLQGSPGDLRRLGSYSRSLNGARAQIEDNQGRSRVTAFASQVSSSQVVQELPARGVSGPYSLTRLPVIENSEKIELLTRDRDQLGNLLKTQPLTRFEDYEIDYQTGRILLKAPLASLSAELNPNSLRITYEVQDGADTHWVGGVDASLRPTNTATLGISSVRDNNPLKPLDLISLGVSVRHDEHTVAVIEAARSRSEGSQPVEGSAVRFEIKHDSDRLKWQAHVQKAQADFDNPSASVTKGVQEAGVKASLKINDGLATRAEYLRSQTLVDQSTRQSAQLGLDYTINDKTRAELSVRHNSSDTPPSATGGVAPTAQDRTSVRLRLTGQLPGYAQTSLFAQYEQDIERSSQRNLTVGADYRLDSGTRLYARHELLSGLGETAVLNEQRDRNTTVIGIQTDTAQDANVFSEYRVRDAIAARESEVAVGLRNRWQFDQGIRLSTGLERVRGLQGPGANDATVLTGGIDYTGAPDWKGSARLELRASDSSDSALATLGGAYRLDQEWSALAKNLLSITKSADGSRKSENWLQGGLAYRGSAPSRVNALLRAEYRYEKAQDSASALTQRHATILSAHLNRQPAPHWLFSGRFAAKWVGERALGLRSRYDTQLISGRLTYDINDRLDLSLQAATLIGGQGRAQQSGLGAELGYLLADNLWGSVGYNWFGFSDKDLTAQDYTNRGLYLRLRWKFDEALFPATTP